MGLLRTLIKRTTGTRECPPIKPNAYLRNGKALVAKQQAGKDLKRSIKAAVDAIGGLRKVVHDGESVLIKPNYVFPRPYPCCTDPAFLKAVIGLVQDAGAGKVAVGERSFFGARTSSVLERMGAAATCRETGAELVDFERDPWVKVRLHTGLMRDIAVTEHAYRYDRIIYLPCLKTHHLARFTMALKLTIGIIHPQEMTTNMFLHMGRLELKTAEINRAIMPDLTITDARQAFVTGGPKDGELAEPGLIIASGDRIANDAIGVQVLRSYAQAPRNLLEWDDPFQYDQIRHAAELGLGAQSMDDITVVH